PIWVKNVKRGTIPAWHFPGHPIGGGRFSVRPDGMAGCLQTLFFVSAIFAAYTLAGYPLLLALRARLRTRPVKKQFFPRSVTVLMPVRNGERWLGAKLDSLLALNYPADLLEILVISD